MSLWRIEKVPKQLAICRLFSFGGDFVAGNFDGIKKQRFGIEIELTGITRDEAAEAIAELFDTDYDHYGGSYDRYDIADAKGRTWKLFTTAAFIR